jgi:hypothetical protein
VDQLVGFVLPVFAFVMVLAFVGFVLVARWRLPPGGRLIGAGLILTFVAAWYSLLTNLPKWDHTSALLGNPSIAEVLAKLAAIMLLGGIVRSLLCRDGAVPPEAPRNVPPSV